MNDWGIEDRVVWRTFLTSPTGVNLLVQLRQARPQAVPKNFSDPSHLSQDGIATVAAHAYKTHGWESCEEFLDDLTKDPIDQDVSANKFM